jgi:hypothetical protein
MSDWALVALVAVMMIPVIAVVLKGCAGGA